MSIMQFTDHDSDDPIALESSAIVGVKGVSNDFGARGSIVYIPGAAFYVKESYEEIMDVDTVLKFNTDTGTWLANREPEMVSAPDQVPYDRRAEAVDALNAIIGRG